MFSGLGRQTLEGLLLVPVGRKGEGDLRKPVAPAALVKGQGNRHVGPLEQLFAIRQEAIDQPGKARRGGVEGGADGVCSHLLQLAGYNGGEQGMRQTCSSRLGEISVLPMDVIHALRA